LQNGAGWPPGLTHRWTPMSGQRLFIVGAGTSLRLARSSGAFGNGHRVARRGPVAEIDPPEAQLCVRITPLRRLAQLNIDRKALPRFSRFFTVEMERVTLTQTIQRSFQSRAFVNAEIVTAGGTGNFGGSGRLSMRSPTALPRPATLPATRVTPAA